MKSIGIRMMAVAFIASAACAGQPKAFEPREAATAQSPAGYLAAEYELSTMEGYLGEAKVWSDGAYRRDIGGEPFTVIHVGFEIENHTRQPIHFITKHLFLDSATLNQRVVRDISPALVEGRRRIPPRRTEQIHVYFALAPGIDPQDVDAFRVRWQIQNGGLTYIQSTPFLESRIERYAPMFYHTPFYDPFFYDPYIYHPRIIVVRRPFRYHHIHPPMIR